jgi:Domain of unknown function (DUF3854)
LQILSTNDAHSDTALNETAPLDLSPAILGKLKESDLNEEDARLLLIRKPTREEITECRIAGRVFGKPGAAFTIPFFDLNGEPTGHYCIRILDQKEPKYLQPRNSGVHLYLPRNLPANITWASIAKDPSISICITEGPLKAACATKHGFPTIGLTGVSCYRSKKMGQPDLLDELKKFVWTNA